MAPSATATIEQYGTLSLKTCDSFDHTITRIASQENVQDGKTKSRELIGGALKRRVEAINADTCEAGEEDAFFVADMGDVYRQHLRWKKHLKRVKPHYGEFWN